jgi:biotin transport system substrate-specific component
MHFKPKAINNMKFFKILKKGTSMQYKNNIISDKLKTLLTIISESRYIWIFSFAVLTAVSAQISIPVKPVPITLQTMAVVLAGAFLGAKNGAYSQILYLFFGIIGLPVFAQNPEAPIGFARLLSPTGGYLIAFPLAAFLTGFIIERNKSYFAVTAGMFAGEILIILLGVVFLDIFFIKNLEQSIISGAAVFSIWTVVKVFTAAAFYHGIRRSSFFK